MKRIWIVIMFFALVFTAGAKGRAAEVKTITSGEYEYRMNEDEKTITIVKYAGDDKKLEIPSEIDGYSVTDIGEEVFRYREFKSVAFPENVRSIGRQAFEYCTISDELQFPENVVIMEDAFSYAKLPAVVTIPQGATTEKCSFSYCETIESLLVEPGATIKSRSFGYCDELVLLLCGDGSQLEEKAFEYCRDLEKVIFCGDVKTEEETFSYDGEFELTKKEAAEYDALKKSALDGSLKKSQDTSSDDKKERTLEILDSPVSVDGVTVVLDKATAKRTDTGGFDYAFSGTIENTTDQGIMQVVYTFALIDENGEEYRSFSEIYDGGDTAIAPHEKIEFSHDGIRWGKQSVPAAVKIGIKTVKTETDLPAEHVPKKGEYLYQALGDEKLSKIKEEPPVELGFHIDQGGYGRTATFKEGADLDKAVELFCKIQIGEESGEWVTDNYNWISFTWKDGTYTVIRLNLHDLEWSIHDIPRTWKLDQLSDFWSYASDYLVED